MFDRFRQRSRELEHLDKGDYTPDEYEGCIIELQRVNRWLGDVRALSLSVWREIERSGKRGFSLLDVGAGSGELLRATDRWAREKEKQPRLVGLELNARSVRVMHDEATSGSTISAISAIRGDAFELPFADDEFDFAMCSLFAHHFADTQVVALLRELGRVARRRIFVIDLHRHPVAYYFYTTVGHLFLHNRLIREDGALSILRGFRPGELAELARRADLEGVSIKRHFPYRLVLAASAPPVAEEVALRRGQVSRLESKPHSPIARSSEGADEMPRMRADSTNA